MMKSELWVMNYERWMMSCEWWVMNDELWVMSCELWVMSYEFLVRSFIASYTILWIRIGYLSETNLIFWGKLIYQSRSDVPLVAVGGNPRNMVIIYLECRRHGLSIYFTDHAYGIFKILGDCFPCISLRQAQRPPCTATDRSCLRHFIMFAY